MNPLKVAWRNGGWVLFQYRTVGEVTIETKVRCRSLAEAHARAACRVAVARAERRAA